MSGVAFSRQTWFWPCAALVLLQCAFAIAMASAFPFIRAARSPIAQLTNFSVPLAMVLLTVVTAKVWKGFRAGEEHPSRALRSSELGVPFLVALMASIHLTAFVTAKPTLGIATHFWADPYLAAVDHWTFGNDPWRLSVHALGPAIGAIDAIYFNWFLVLMITLAFTTIRGHAGAIKAFFLTWTAGMFAQFLFPSGGPVFFARNGFGDRFSDISASPLTRLASDTLWAVHDGNAVGAASGISAWPSLHVAMAAWAALFWRHPLAYLWCGTIAFGSVALGWHYFSDGLAGAVMALACWFVCNRNHSPMVVAAERARRLPFAVSARSRPGTEPPLG